jgi:hypothetical protein
MIENTFPDENPHDYSRRTWRSLPKRIKDGLDYRARMQAHVVGCPREE